MDEDLFKKFVRDSYGFRVIPNNETRTAINVETLAHNAAQTHKDTYGMVSKYTLEEALEDFHQDGFNGKIWKELTEEQQHAVRDIFIENRSQGFVDKLIKDIQSRKVDITKITNYTSTFDEKLPYFTEKQLMEINDVFEEVYGRKIPIYSVEGGNPNGATRKSGYTAAQMNIIFSGDYRRLTTELQYRDIEVEEFADLEHIRYDIEENKITVRGNKYSNCRYALESLSENAKTLYNKYSSDLYAYYRQKALGVKNAEKPDLEKMFAEALKDGRLSQQEYDKVANLLHYISEEGLREVANS